MIDRAGRSCVQLDICFSVHTTLCFPVFVFSFVVVVYFFFVDRVRLVVIEFPTVSLSLVNNFDQSWKSHY